MRPSAFQVGQLWRSQKAYGKVIFRITRITDDDGIFALRSGSSREERFTHSGSRPGSLTPDWILVDEDDYNKNDWMSWRHNQPGECVCGIPRSQCDYHG